MKHVVLLQIRPNQLLFLNRFELTFRVFFVKPTVSFRIVLIFLFAFSRENGLILIKISISAHFLNDFTRCWLIIEVENVVVRSFKLIFLNHSILALNLVVLYYLLIV